MDVNPMRTARGMAKSAVIAANRMGAMPTGLAGRDKPIGAMFAGATGAPLARAVAGKVVLITGASSGIGQASAYKLGAAGATVLLVARSADELEATRERIVADGGSAFAYRCDLTDFDDLDAMVAKVLDQHGRVDILVNNAGHSIRRKVERSEGRFHDFERPMTLNYFAAIRLVMAVLPGMRDRESGQIINISTWAVQVRPARFSGYTASKAALEAWSDCVQGEVIDDGVLFTTVRMPLVRTPMIEPTKIYRRLPALTPDEAAQAVADAVVYRPRRLRPAFSTWLAMADAVSPRLMDQVRSRAI